MERFKSGFFNINSLAYLDEEMGSTEDAERYNIGITEEENENSNRLPLVMEETSDSSDFSTNGFPEVPQTYTSIVHDLNLIFKDFPLTFYGSEELIKIFEDQSESSPLNPSRSGLFNGEQNVDNNNESIRLSETISTVPTNKLTSSKQEVKTVNINYDKENNIIVVSDDEDENSVQLNGEQNNTVVLSDDEDENGLETCQVVPFVQLTRNHELRSAKNIKKILPKFKSKVQENLQYLTSKRQDFVVSSVDGYKLVANDIAKLITPKAWLTDVIILHYLSLLVQHSKNVLLLDPDMFRSCIQKGFVPEWYQEKLNKTYEYNKIIIPINPNRNHWALVVLEIREGKMNIIDSIKGTNNSKELKLVYKFINLAFKMTIPNGFKEVRQHSPLQTNTDDCGVFTCTNARYYTYDTCPDYAQRDIPLLRHRIAWELLNKTIIPF